MIRALLCGGAAFGYAIFLATAVSNVSVSERARKLHFSSIVIDTHADTTQRLLDKRFDLGTRHSDGSVDIPRMREGGLSAIFFSIWVSGRVRGDAAVQRAMSQIAAVHRQVKLHPEDLVLARSAGEIRSAHAAGKIATLMGVEGGHMMHSDLGVLRKFAELGVSYMTLTHGVNVEWADSSGDKPVHHGLTPFGREVIHEMNRLGMTVDISHVSDKTFWDVLEVSTAPVIATHSSCRAICSAPRNMTDKMLKAVADKGGVIQINYHVAFLSQEFWDAKKADPKINSMIEAQVLHKCGDDEACQLMEGDRLTREQVAAGKLPRVDFMKIVEHVDHAVRVAGIDHVGLGSDFDGANMPYGMEDASKLPLMTQALLDRGYSESDVKKILGENTLRVMEQVERVGAEMRAAAPK